MTAAPPRRIRLTKQDRRAQLLAEATLQIAHSGYQGFTMDGLAKASRLTHAGVLHHFASKKELLVEVLRHRDELDAAAALPDSAIPSDPAGLRAVLDALVERNFRQPEIVRLYTVLSAEALNPEHPAHEYFRDRLQQIRRLIAGSLALPPGIADDFAVDYLSFMDGLQLNWLRDPTIDFLGRWRDFADGLLARVDRG
ncbi:AcrR family transcriptional regulator [Leifsonia sp. EB41]|uniref:TetR/AcrR family transcriptional regulator n=1 Tax=Leifsonia sp. EB41 TaxID=3156260 RepID=UPI0035175DAC